MSDFGSFLVTYLITTVPMILYVNILFEGIDLYIKSAWKWFKILTWNMMLHGVWSRFYPKNKNCLFFTFHFLQNQIKTNPDFFSFFDKNTKDYQIHDQIQEASNFKTGSIAGMYLVNYRCKLDSLKIFLMKICHLKIEIETRLRNQK